MTLTITHTVFQQMLETAQMAAPLEACGLLAGTGTYAARCYVLTNTDASPEHFSMKPEEQFAAVKDMRRHGHEMLAIWHSHPATPARMSAEDMRLAYTPEIVHVILSLADPVRPVLRAFTVRDGVAYEKPIQIEEQKDESL